MALLLSKPFANCHRVIYLFSLVGFLPFHHCSNIVLMHKLQVTVRGHHMCALQDMGSKMMLLCQNTFPKDMPDKVPLPEDCKSQGHILLEGLDVSHWCMIDLLGKQDTLMLHQDCTSHLGISNQWIQDRKWISNLTFITANNRALWRRLDLVAKISLTPFFSSS